MDAPKPRLEPELGRRRHRRLTGPGGILLFACMFLPGVTSCGSPVYPLELPTLLPPYLYGFGFALAAATVTTRGMRHAITALRGIAAIAVVASVVMITLAPAIGIVELVATSVVLVLLGWRGYSEQRTAVATAVAGCLSALWFGMWMAMGDVLVGAYLSALGSAVLLAGGIVWLAETALARQPPIVVPVAIARQRQ